MEKIKDSKKHSKKIATMLEQSISALKCGNGIVIAADDGKRMAVYPSEFCNNRNEESRQITNNKTAIALAKRAGLLPVLFVLPENLVTNDWPIFSESELKEALDYSPAVFETARAKLPLNGAENSTIVSFRTIGNENVHLALIIGEAETTTTVPLVRVHSSCVTGDLLGSLRCDCGDQLKQAINAIKESGYGVLLYLNQEGRGIGITNKVRAYALQEQGCDTYEANHELGFDSDERDFSIAAQMLRILGLSKIRLLSNNPHKLSELQKHGIEIAERVSLIITPHPHNKNYLMAKANKAGHILNDE